jgi:hypothetical protein
MGNYNSYEDNPDIPLVSGLKDLIAPEAWKAMSKEAKVEFAEAHKEHTQDVNVVLATLKSASETNTKAAEMTKDIIAIQHSKQKEIYDSITKMISQSKTIAEQQATQEEYTLGLGITTVQKDNIQLKQLNTEIKSMEDGILQLQKGTIEYKKLYDELLKLKMQRDKLQKLQMPGDIASKSISDSQYKYDISVANLGNHPEYMENTYAEQLYKIQLLKEKIVAKQKEIEKLQSDNPGKYMELDQWQKAKLELKQYQNELDSTKGRYALVREGGAEMFDSFIVQGN